MLLYSVQYLLLKYKFMSLWYILQLLYDCFIGFQKYIISTMNIMSTTGGTNLILINCIYRKCVIPETTVTIFHIFYKKSPLFRIFLIALRGRENVKCFWGWNFFIHLWESGKEWFCPFKLFSKLKQHSVNIEHQLKSKLEWPACIKNMKLKLKWHRRSYKAGTSEVFIGL